MRPYGPDPLRSERDIPFYPASFLAIGLANILSDVELLIGLLWTYYVLGVTGLGAYWGFVGADVWEVPEISKSLNLLTSSCFLAKTATGCPTGIGLEISETILARNPFSVA